LKGFMPKKVLTRLESGTDGIVRMKEQCHVIRKRLRRAISLTHSFTLLAHSSCGFFYAVLHREEFS
jgi:hypothetical protein